MIQYQKKLGHCFHNPLQMPTSFFLKWNSVETVESDFWKKVFMVTMAQVGIKANATHKFKILNIIKLELIFRSIKYNLSVKNPNILMMLTHLKN